MGNCPTAPPHGTPLDLWISVVICSRYWWCWIECLRRRPLSAACLLQASSHRRLGHMTTRDACWDRPWAQTTSHSAYRSTAWTPSASACALEGWSGRRTPCRSVRSRTASRRCANAGAPVAATVARTTYHILSSGIWGRGWECASTTPASTRTPATSHRHPSM